MEEKDTIMHEQLEDQDLQQTAGGVIDCANAPKVYCSKCEMKAFASPAKVIKGKIARVYMECTGSYSLYSTGERGYCYRCPECGYELRKAAK